MSKKISNQIKQKIIEEYQNKPITFRELSKKYNICIPVLGKICKHLRKWNRTQLFSPELDEHWFKNIDNELKAYYLGLFISDGNVCKPNKREQDICSLTLKNEDSYLLEIWLKEIKSNRKVAQDGRGCCQASVLSNIMSEDLSNYGITPQKTSKEILPNNIDEKYMSALIRGLIDGDGSIQAKWYVGKDGRKRFRHIITLCGSYTLVNSVDDYLRSILNITTPKNVYTYKNKPLSEISYRNYADIKKIGNFIYNNANIFMKRKKENYDLILERMTTVC